MSRSQSSRSAGLRAREAAAMARTMRESRRSRQHERGLLGPRAQLNLALLAMQQARDVGVVAQDHEQRDEPDDLRAVEAPGQKIGIGGRHQASDERRKRGISEDRGDD